VLNIILYRLKRVWQERVSRGDPFYVKLADTILKDVRRTDQHVKFFKSKIHLCFCSSLFYLFS